MKDFRRVLSFALAIVGTVLPSCTTISVQPVATFAVATESLVDSSSRAYMIVDDSRVTREIYDVASSQARDPNDATFAPLISSEDEKTQAALKLRFDLLEELGDYATALKALCEADFGIEIDEAMSELNGALVGLRESYKQASGKDAPLSDDAAGIIATAVGAIGKEIVEAKRQDALKTIIIQVNPAVQVTTELISHDLGNTSQMAKFARENVSNTYGSLRTVYLRDRKSMTFDQRLNALQRMRALKQVEEDTATFFEDVSVGVAQVGQGHAALVTAATTKDSSFKGFTTTVGLIVKKAKAAEKFYKTLDEGNPAAAGCTGGK